LSVAALTAVALTGRTATAQNVTVPALKAAFLYNFAKFTEWPAEAAPPGAPLVLCVLGDGDVADALEGTVKGRSIDGHDLSIRRVKLDSSVRTCHLLYVSSLDEKRSLELLDLVKGASVLTVSDLDHFAQLGGVAHFFTEAGKMRFAINVESAQRAKIHLSSKLLGLATVVKDERNVP